jgi:hypothetical protein
MVESFKEILAWWDTDGPPWTAQRVFKELSAPNNTKHRHLTKILIGAAFWLAWVQRNNELHSNPATPSPKKTLQRELCAGIATKLSEINQTACTEDEKTKRLESFLIPPKILLSPTGLVELI